MTIHLEQTGSINTIQTGTTQANSSADLRITSIGTSGSTYMTIATTGNVGIGTTSPSQKLDVTGTINASNYTGTNITIGTLNATSGITSGSSQFSSLIITGGSLNATFNSNTIGSLITTGGNVGIGTTSPTSLFQVGGSGRFKVSNGASDFTMIGTQDTDNARNTRIIVSGNDRIGANGFINYIATNNGRHTWTITDNTNYSDHMCLVSSGNVGIGTISPSSKLHINGATATNGSLLITGSDNFGHSLYIASSDASKRLAFNNNGTVGNIFAYNYSSSAAQNLCLQAYGGNVGIATTSPKTRLDIRKPTQLSDTIPTTEADGSTILTLLNNPQNDSNYGLLAGVLATTGLVWLQSKYTHSTTNLSMALQPLGGTLLVGASSHEHFTNPFTVRADHSSAQIMIQGKSDTRKTMQIGYDTTNNYAYIDSLYHNVAWTNTIFCRNGGNVGIGTSSPSWKLDISGGWNVTSESRFTGSQRTSHFLYGGDQEMYLRAGTNNGTVYINDGLNGAVVIGGSIYANPYKDADGRNYVTHGTSSPATNVDARLNIQDRADVYVRFYAGSGGSSVLRGSITNSGATTLYNSSSDYRLKENIVPLTNAINRLVQIPVHRFNFKEFPGSVLDGFLAHEVQSIVPEAVTGEKDALDNDGNIKAQCIDQSKLVPLLTAALKEEISSHAITKQELTDLKAFLQSKFPGEI